MPKFLAWFLGVWLWGMGASAMACSCMESDFEQDYSNANVVFVGRCIDISTNAIKGDLNVVFQIDSSWKRAIEPVMTIHTAHSSAACGYAFEKGKRYVVFAHKAHQTLSTGLCTSNGLADTPGLLEKLGKGIPTGRPEFARSMNLLLILLGVGGLLFIALVVLRKRIFRPRAGS